MGTAFRLNNGSVSNVVVDCTVNTDVGDYVYISATGIADLADASHKTKMPCIGYVINKPEVNKAEIVSFYIEKELSNILNKKNYFISDTVAGAIQDNQPNGKNSVSQVVAVGIGTNSILINIDPDSAVINNN